MIYRVLNINELNIEDISKSVSTERIKKSEKFKHESDRKRSIAVEYLLNEMIKEQYPQIETPVVLTYDENEKPHIYYSEEDKRDLIHFSLSHSGDYVACIISEYPCGIDVERYSERRPYEKILKRTCTENEIEMVHGVEDFYNIWTLKESVLKAVGLGLSLDMRSFEFEKVDEGTLNNSNSEDGKVECTYITEALGVKYIGKTVSALNGYALSYVEENHI